MRLLAVLAAILLVAGCVVNDSCLDCDDGNPCTQDSCLSGECSHQKLAGPVEGCYGVGGCTEYSCFDGACIPQKIMKCCGNGVCDFGENYSSCLMDCKPTCFDGIKNQDEDGVDCGGPCQPCQMGEYNYLNKLGAYRQMWFDIAGNYTLAIKAYNSDKDLKALRNTSIKVYGEVGDVRALALNSTAPPEYASTQSLLNVTLSLYMQAVDSMVSYTASKDERRRVSANRVLSDALDNDKLFVEKYNGMAREYNRRVQTCENHRLDQGEESVDCGGICDAPCSKVVNVTKFVTMTVENGPASVIVNISSPAADYPPQQKVLATYLKPRPDFEIVTPEGNMYYGYDIQTPAYGNVVFKITQTLRLNREAPPAKSASDYFSSKYLVANQFSSASDEICFRAKALKTGANTTAQTVSRLQGWMITNIQYEANEEEFGADYCYINKRGACDEQADLFVSLARCVGIPARRVTGSLINGSQMDGHAWAEYYDGGWVYIDPSIKNADLAVAPDNKHVTACIGEGAYHCGVGYMYTYSGRKPKIIIEERTVLG